MGDSSSHAVLGGPRLDVTSIINNGHKSNTNNSSTNNNNNTQVTSAGNTLLKTPTTMECGQCKIQRPNSARHCSYCQVCIDELDHHCPWSGKCIGKDNIHVFYVFISALCFQLYYIIGVFIYYMIYVSKAVANLPVGPSF